METLEQGEAQAAVEEVMDDVKMELSENQQLNENNSATLKDGKEEAEDEHKYKFPTYQRDSYSGASADLQQGRG